MTSLAHRERLALSDTLLLVGPDAPTLSGSWTTRDLAAHLLLRERNPAAVGIAMSAFSGWTRRTQRALAARPYDELVADIREGPPWWSPLRAGRIDELANTFEYFVHHEDIRRAQPDWRARRLTDVDEATLGKIMTKRVQLFLRRSRQQVVLDAGKYGRLVVGSGTPVEVRGLPSELVLYLHGRMDHALVDIEGDADAVEQFRQLRLNI